MDTDPPGHRGKTGNSKRSSQVFFNPYAAVPSMHVACAVILGWTLARLVLRSARSEGCSWALWPLFITFLTVITANHFLIDAVLGLFVTAASPPRPPGASPGIRPHVWTFDRRGAGIPAGLRAAPPSPSRERASRRPSARARRERRAIPPLHSIEGDVAMMRNRLIESRLTPNAISLTGFALNLVAAALVWEQLFFVGGVAFIVGSIMDTLDGRYSRMSGKGTAFGAFLTRRSTAARRASC